MKICLSVMLQNNSGVRSRLCFHSEWRVHSNTVRPVNVVTLCVEYEYMSVMIPSSRQDNTVTLCVHVIHRLGCLSVAGSCNAVLGCYYIETCNATPDSLSREFSELRQAFYFL